MGFLYRILGLFLLVATLTVASGEYHYGRKEKKDQRYDGDKHDYKKMLNCYQCAWSPGRTVYKTVTYYDEAKVADPYGYDGKYVTKHIRRTKQVPEERIGGWGPCKGPFSRYQAKSFGIKSHKCENNCFSRVDSNGNIYRGCYEGEWGVDPTKLGCHHQAGSLYCFCGKDNCNNQVVPEYEKAH